VGIGISTIPGLGVSIMEIHLWVGIKNRAKLHPSFFVSPEHSLDFF